MVVGIDVRTDGDQARVITPKEVGIGLHVAAYTHVYLYSNGAMARYTISKPTVARHLAKMADVLKAAEAAHLPAPSTARCHTRTHQASLPPEEPGTVGHRRDVSDRFQKRRCAQ
jgi:hypothetical protein